MRRQDAHPSIEYEWEREDGTTYTFRIDGIISPYVPMSMYGGPDHLGWPEEGGEVEDIVVELLSATDEEGYLLSVSPQRANSMEAVFESQIDTDPVLRERVETALRAAAAVDCEPPDHGDY